MINSNISLDNSIISLDKPDNIWKYLYNSKNIKYFWLGRQNYMPIWKLQQSLHQQRVRGKICDVVLFLEHDHVYTFGKNSNTNLLLDSRPIDINIIKTDRGGEVTYHGPGQLVGYPILDLHNYKKSVSWYIRGLEAMIINVLKSLKLKAGRKEDLTGVWIGDEKICAMGIRLSRWVTMHGFALNINPNLQYYDGMIPCGIFNYGITSLNNHGIKISMKDIMHKIINSFVVLFESNINEI